jgi:putative membrane protein
VQSSVRHIRTKGDDTLLSLDLTALHLILLGAALYLRATYVLRHRGYRVPPLQQACWFGALTAIGFALESPLDDLGDADLVSAHMAQHVLLIDVAAPLLILGLRSPVYAFMLPPTLLAPLARNRVLRRVFRSARRPLVAAAIFIATIWIWHLAPAYEAALESPLMHALQHQCFLLAGMIFWLPVLEPWHRRVPGGLWKIGYVGGTRLLSMFVGFALVATRHPIYESFYGSRSLEHGLSPLSDQQLAGTLMMVADVSIMLGALVFFFLRTAQDEEDGQTRSDLPSDISAEELAAAAAREAGQGWSPSTGPS